jgi:uncharacterized membrane protein
MNPLSAQVVMRPKMATSEIESRNRRRMLSEAGARSAAAAGRHAKRRQRRSQQIIPASADQFPVAGPPHPSP